MRGGGPHGGRRPLVRLRGSWPGRDDPRGGGQTPARARPLVLPEGAPQGERDGPTGRGQRDQGGDN
eukprot:2745459-Alexandrium_andersonii.AAC.1